MTLGSTPEVANLPFERPDANPGFSHVVHFSPNINAEEEDIQDKEAMTVSSTIPATTSDAATTTSEVRTDPPIETTSDPPIETTPRPTTTEVWTTEATTTGLTTTLPTEHSTSSSQEPETSSTTTTTTTTSAATTTTTSATTSTITTTSVTTKRPAFDLASSQANGFASSSQQFASFVHSKDHDKGPAKEAETERQVNHWLRRTFLPSAVPSVTRKTVTKKKDLRLNKTKIKTRSSSLTATKFRRIQMSISLKKTKLKPSIGYIWKHSMWTCYPSSLDTHWMLKIHLKWPVLFQNTSCPTSNIWTMDPMPAN
jgi:hypothetical protein